MENTQLKFKKVLLIDTGTADIAGSYIDELFTNIKSVCEIDVVVNYYFPFTYGLKLFFKYSDLSAKHKYNFKEYIRLPIRLIELLLGLIKILFLIRRKNHDLIIYALSTNLKIEYFFLLIIKKMLKKNLWVICHDVIPFVYKNEDFNSKTKKRGKFFYLADKLIVHNQNSIEDLKNIYGINLEKILIFRFPIFNLDYLNQTSSQNSILKDLKLVENYFLFIGHLRDEKGITLLLESWKCYSDINPEKSLIIAGKFPRGGTSLLINDFKLKNLIFINEYIDDSTFCQLIDKSYAVILPYKRATNSGILSSVLSRGKPLIVSDIPLFKQNELINDKFIFESKNAQSLTDKLMYISKMKNDEYLDIIFDIKIRIKLYRDSFSKEVKDLFK